MREGANKTWKAQNGPLFTEKYPHIIRTTKALCPRAPDCTTAAGNDAARKTIVLQAALRSLSVSAVSSPL